MIHFLGEQVGPGDGLASPAGAAGFAKAGDALGQSPQTPPAGRYLRAMSQVKRR
jgi:hypothetical protein